MFCTLGVKNVTNEETIRSCNGEWTGDGQRRKAASRGIGASGMEGDRSVDRLKKAGALLFE
jgi:hypothetical protein